MTEVFNYCSLHQALIKQGLVYCSWRKQVCSLGYNTDLSEVACDQEWLEQYSLSLCSTRHPPGF